eukprot:134504-Pleurochrysis_carterae.AAC.4
MLAGPGGVCSRERGATPSSFLAGTRPVPAENKRKRRRQEIRQMLRATKVDGDGYGRARAVARTHAGTRDSLRNSSSYESDTRHTRSCTPGSRACVYACTHARNVPELSRCASPCPHLLPHAEVVVAVLVKGGGDCGGCGGQFLAHGHALRAQLARLPRARLRQKEADCAYDEGEKARVLGAR